MKKIFTLVLLFCSLQSFGQLTLVKEVNDNLFKSKTPFFLSNGNKMFYTLNEKSITLYNSDFSIYKTINRPELYPSDKTEKSINTYYGYPNSITNNLTNSNFIFSDYFFNNDSKIEFIVRSYKNDSTVSVLLNEDGQEIQRFINTFSSEMEFLYWDNLYVVSHLDNNNYNFQTKIYSIPGNLPCPSSCSQKAAGIAPISQPNEFKKIQVTDFPNPSSEKVTLAYTLPEGVSFGTLRLYTQTGELVKEFKVSSQVDHLELPVSEYNSGTYFYELQAGGSSSGGKKMVVIH